MTDAELIDHLNGLLMDAARSGEYMLGHQSARREVAEMLWRDAKEQQAMGENEPREPARGRHFFAASCLRANYDAIRALPDPGEPPPWEEMQRLLAERTAALVEIAGVPAGDLEQTQIARKALGEQS